ncbi:unnamed protein product [Trichobilharzia szidati]|nr:unnamed protein product [Trichobilharzia szidati]
MPTQSRLVVYSALAVTLVYLLNYYRRKRKLKLVSERSLSQASGYCLTSQSTCIHETSDYLQDLVTEEGSLSPINASSESFVKIIPVDGYSVALKESVSELQSVSFLDAQPPAEKAFCSVTPSYLLQMEVIQSVTSRLKTNSGSESDRALTPDSNDGLCGIPLPPDGFSDPSNDIYEANPEEINGKILPTVLIPSDMWAEAVDRDIWHETFLIPAYMGGVLIGRLGKNVRELRNSWQAEFNLNTCPGKQDTLVLKLSCPLRHKNDVLRWVAHRFKMRPSMTTIGNPSQLKRHLPLGEPVPVQIRSLYGSKELFLTIPDEEYNNYLEMQTELDKDYTSTNSYRMQLCEPVTSGTVAVVPHSHGFARALIISVYPTWPKTAFYYLLDHGIFGVVQLNKIKKIRAKYMRVPFQAIHVSWAHAFPVYSDIPDLHLLRTFFNSGRVHAFAVRMETCCRASVAFGEPYSQPYSSHGFLDILANACSSGLYMAVPLLIYPRRQCWLNNSSIPYYPFTYSYIDYQSLVSFAIEDDEAYASTNQLPSYHQDISENHSSSVKNQKTDQNRFNDNSRSHSNGPRWGHRNNTTSSKYNSRRQNTSGSNHIQKDSVLTVSQKENQCNSEVKENTNATKPTSERNDHLHKNQPRKPLSNRNNGVNSSGCSKAVSSNHDRVTTTNSPDE